LHQHHLAALDDFLDLVLTAWPERTLRNLLQDVVAADGFDDFLFGVLALIVVIVAVLAGRDGDLALMDDDGLVM
jgi:hypothetical protein